MNNFYTGANYQNFSNAVEAAASSQNWADIAGKIGKKVAPFTKEYMLQRFGCSSSFNKDSKLFVIAQLKLAAENIENKIEKGRVTGVAKELEKDLANCSASGLVEGNKPHRDLYLGGNDIANMLQQIFGGGPPTNDYNIDVQTGDLGNPAKKPNNTIWWVVGGVTAVGFVSIVIWAVVKRNKAG